MCWSRAHQMIYKQSYSNTLHTQNCYRFPCQTLELAPFNCSHEIGFFNEILNNSHNRRLLVGPVDWFICFLPLPTACAFHTVTPVEYYRKLWYALMFFILFVWRVGTESSILFTELVLPFTGCCTRATCICKGLRTLFPSCNTFYHRCRYPVVALKNHISILIACMNCMSYN